MPKIEIPTLSRRRCFPCQSLADRGRTRYIGGCAVGRVPPPKRSIGPDAASFETPMSVIIALAALILSGLTGCFVLLTLRARGKVRA